jgi:hypothetical protein
VDEPERPFDEVIVASWSPASRLPGFQKACLACCESREAARVGGVRCRILLYGIKAPLRGGRLRAGASAPVLAGSDGISVAALSAHVA